LKRPLASDNLQRDSRPIQFGVVDLSSMRALSSSQVAVGKGVLLDGRLALFHKRERWLAVTDLHFGYELSQRAAGNLFPLWGMQTIENRLEELLRDYSPSRLIILGDLVHDRAAAREAGRLIKRLSRYCNVLLIAGNHDHELGDVVELVDSWKTKRFHFHHGHGAIDRSDRVQIIGHYHPAGTMADSAGLRLKLPAFVQKGNRWMLPAFSPWSSGTDFTPDQSSRVWLCSPQRILHLETS
jgi:DNA ligase-associated metallophosphoesterase